MTSPGFCSISVSILVRRFLLPGSHSSSPGVSMLFLLLRNSPGISFQLSPPSPPSSLHLLHSGFVFSFPFTSSFFFKFFFKHYFLPSSPKTALLPQNWLSQFIFCSRHYAHSAADGNLKVLGRSWTAHSQGQGTGRGAGTVVASGRVCPVMGVFCCPSCASCRAQAAPPLSSLNSSPTIPAQPSFSSIAKPLLYLTSPAVAPCALTPPSLSASILYLL